MKKEKSRLLSLIGITLLCAVLGLKVGALIFGAVTILKALRYWQDPDRVLKERILREAKFWEVQIPDSYLVRKKIFSIYMKIQRKERLEPAFISSFSTILDEFWQRAGEFENLAQWFEGLEYLDRHIPKLSTDNRSLSEALSEMQNLNLHLEKATAQVKTFYNE